MNNFHVSILFLNYFRLFLYSCLAYLIIIHINDTMWSQAKEVKIMRYKTNEIKIKENHAELIIYSAGKSQRFTSYIDLEDVDYVKKHSWCIRSRKPIG